MASICVLGAGYVGLVSGACLADFGNIVVCVDTNTSKIEKLKAGIVPIYEPGLEDVVRRNVQSGRLSFSTDALPAIQKCDVVFIAVGTPPSEDGSADLSYVEAAARMIGRAMCGYKVVVDKSTVPIGTARKVSAWIGEEIALRNIFIAFDVVSNPEFLREGSAVYDFMHPDRVVLGIESERCKAIMKDVYRSLYLNETPFVETNLETAEMIKYASNSFLAVKITFINEIANLCEAVGADVKAVSLAMGKDGRIGSKFLHPGPGYGGSCFPKDTRALAAIAKRSGERLRIVDAAIEANEAQKARMAGKILQALGEPKGKVVALLGLAFKPNTDDMREAPSLHIVQRLVALGVCVRIYDPAAMREASWRLAEFSQMIVYCSNEYEAMEGADALVIATEWNQFRNLDLEKVKALLRTSVILDLRNIYDRDMVEKAGFRYFCVGR